MVHFLISSRHSGISGCSGALELSLPPFSPLYLQTECWLLEKRPLLTLFFIYSPHQYSCTPSLYLRSFEVISHCIKTREAGGKIAWEPTLIRPGKTESWRKSAIGFIPTACLIHQTADQYLTVIPTPTHSLAMHNPPTCPIAREGWGFELRGSRGYVWQSHHELIHFGSSQPLHYGIRCSRLHVDRAGFLIMVLTRTAHFGCLITTHDEYYQGSWETLNIKKQIKWFQYK